MREIRFPISDLSFSRISGPPERIEARRRRKCCAHGSKDRLLRSAPLSWAQLRSELKRPASMRFIQLNPPSFAQARAGSTKFDSLGFGSLRSDNDPGFLLQSFQIAVPCLSRARCSSFAMNRTWGGLGGPVECLEPSLKSSCLENESRELPRELPPVPPHSRPYHS